MTKTKKDIKYMARFLTEGIANEIEFESYGSAEDALTEPYESGVIPDYEIVEVIRTTTEKVVFTTKKEEDGEVKPVSIKD